MLHPWIRQPNRTRIRAVISAMGLPRAIAFAGCVVTAVLYAQASWAGSIIITATPFASPGASMATVRLDLTIVDNGGAPDCGGFVIQRRLWWPSCSYAGQVQCILRQPGTRTLQFYDGVPANCTLEYEVVGYMVFGGQCAIPSNTYDFRRTFDPHGWGFPVSVFTTVGPDPTPVAQGTVTTANEPTAAYSITPVCSDGCEWAWQGNDAEALPYLNTGTHVWVYGTIDYCCNCCGWMVTATQVVPHECSTVAIAPHAWGQVKRLYR